MNLAPDDALDLSLRCLREAGLVGEVSVSRGETWEAAVRLGKLESVKSSLSNTLRITAYGPGGRMGSSSATDCSEASVRATAQASAALAAHADADPCNGLAPGDATGMADAHLELDDPSYAGLDREALVAQAIAAEGTALAYDPRIINSHRSGCSASRGQRWFATSAGLRLCHAGTRYGINATVMAESASEKFIGGWGSSARHVGDLLLPAEVGTIAGRKAVEGFGWSKLTSGPIAVVLANEVASSLLDTIGNAVMGGNIYRGQSWLAAGGLGARIAPDHLTIMDDPLIPRALGSRPCDGEGVRARRLALIEHGVVRSWMVGSYAARRLGHPCTGHESGTSNLRLVPGTNSRETLLAQLGDGLLVTGFRGFGVDLAGGRISKGAVGFRVVGGRIDHPVQGVTLAGDLRELLLGIEAVGDDPTPQSSTSSPSLRMRGWTLGGT